MSSTCENCRFSIPNPQSTDQRLCAFNPPTVFLLGVKKEENGTISQTQQISLQPIVWGQGWCGQWQPREENLN